MKTFDFSTYISPLTWRYGSPEMRYIFSEERKYQLWRKIWVALAQAQHKAGLVSSEELKDLQAHEKDINIERILEIEKETQHDVVAAIREFAEKAKVGGGKIHLGATSMDIVDNTDALRMKAALSLIEKQLITLLGYFAPLIEKHAHTPCIGYTHLQPAEPTTVGYRLSFYAQDLLTDLELLKFVIHTIKAKGMKGAVGTGASYHALLPEGYSSMETDVMAKLGIEAATITSQVYSRKYDYLALVVCTSITASLAKFAADLRILQSPQTGEWSEPFGASQVGSSAMPFKKNPLNSEKICSLARLVGQYPTVASENASHSYLERTLDDSANKRVIIPEAFLLTDEILQTAIKLVTGLNIHEKKIAHNLSQFAPFAATESLIIEAVKKGADRQWVHEKVRELSMRCWEAVMDEKSNPMQELVKAQPEITRFVSAAEIDTLFDVTHHVGDAPQRALTIKKAIDATVQTYEK